MFPLLCGFLAWTGLRKGIIILILSWFWTIILNKTLLRVMFLHWKKKHGFLIIRSIESSCFSNCLFHPSLSKTQSLFNPDPELIQNRLVGLSICLVMCIIKVSFLSNLYHPKQGGQETWRSIVYYIYIYTCLAPSLPFSEHAAPSILFAANF